MFAFHKGYYYVNYGKNYFNLCKQTIWFNMINIIIESLKPKYSTTTLFMALIGCYKMSPMCSMHIINPDRSWYEPWRFLMYGFVHNSFMHLIGNVICQIVFGLFLELSHGSTRVGIIYLSGILLGGIGREISNEEQRPLAGASGKHVNHVIISRAELFLSHYY